MKERYQDAEVEVIELQIEDVVRTSGDCIVEGMNSCEVEMPFIPVQ